MNILVINGQEPYKGSKGILNRTLTDTTIDTLRNLGHTVEVTIVKKGYDVDEEIAKFKHANSVIFQTPVFWFSVPGVLKTYVDRVYQYGVFFEGSEEYGRGGLMRDKTFMVSSTWNAEPHSFDDGQFNAGQSPDDILMPFYKTQEYCGLTPLEHFAALDVIAHPDIDRTIPELNKHLERLYA